MQETDLHDLSDDADYAASLQHGSSSMMRSDSGKKSSSSEPDGAEVVYTKDNVTIHPTQFASERIGGRLKLLKHGSSLFMTWIPYKGQNSNARLSEKDRNLYTIRALPFTDLRSIRRHTPALGWQYIIVVLSSGMAFPPLYFYNGGVKEFLATIKQHVFLVRSAEDANIFLVNDFENPLQRTLSSLELPRAVPGATGHTPATSSESLTQEKSGGGAHDESAYPSQYNRRQRQKNHDLAQDLSISVLEKFSLVTKFARETTSQLFGDGHSNGFGASERPYNNIPIDFTRKASIDEDKVSNKVPVVPDPVEKSNRKQKVEEAATNVGNFELINFDEFCENGAAACVKSIYQLLLKMCLFELIVFPNSLQLDKLSLVLGKSRQPPLGSKEWTTFLDSEGRVIDPKNFRKRIFYGGAEHCLRKEIWAFLLGYYAYDSTYAEREFLQSVKKSHYETLKHQWQSISPEQSRRFTKFRERKGVIEKDVVRTDRTILFYDGDDNPNVNLLRDILLTYSFYNFDLGYCQGMSDLLSPILFVMEDESEAFWCFVALMERLGPNFNRDQNGMHSQLFALSKLVELLDSPLHNYLKQNECLNYFFCFRWVLIQFKREFEYAETMRLWEVLWTHHLSEHMHLYVCVAILKRHRSKIMGEQMDFDTLLKFINDLTGQIELDSILRDAEALCMCAGENGAASIPPGTPPSLSADNDSLLYSPQDDEQL